MEPKFNPPQGGYNAEVTVPELWRQLLTSRESRNI